MSDVSLLKAKKERCKYENIYLKPLDYPDLPSTLKWRNEYREWFNSTDIILPEAHQNWFEYYQLKDDDIVFVVQDEQHNLLGQVAVYGIDKQEKKAEFGRFLTNPDFTGKGYMKKSLFALLNFCTDVLGLDSLFLEVKEHNLRAKHIYDSAGFVVIGKNNDNILMHWCKRS